MGNDVSVITLFGTFYFAVMHPKFGHRKCLHVYRINVQHGRYVYLSECSMPRIWEGFLLNLLLHWNS
jgi:hypothetical protein